MSADMDPPQNLPSYHLFTQPTDPAVLADRSRAWNGTDFSFHDLVDIINPLQHLPVISTVYRYLTGDTIGAIPRIIGDTLYGGPIGFAAGLVGASLKQESGKDVGETMIAMVTGDDSVATNANVAANGSPTAPASQASTTAAPAAAASVAMAAPSAVPATAVGVPVSATVVGGPGSIASLAATAKQSPAAPPPGAIADGDPRAAFLARADAMRRQYGGSGGATPTNKVVPLQLQGIALPPGYSSQPSALKLSAPGLPGTPSSGGASSGATATTVAAATAAATPGQPSPALPTNPPIDVSQQMMDALDKYMRLQQQRDPGSQVDVVH